MSNLTSSPTVRLDYHLAHTVIPVESCEGRQSRSFPLRPRTSP